MAINTTPDGGRGGGFSTRGTLANYQRLTGESLDVQSTDNPEFAWPDKYIRQIDGSSRKLQRGFIRSILTDKDIQTKLAPNSNAITRRLWFQFNPDFIERAVSQQIGAMNPLLQAPSNLIQAVPGTSTFGFTLQFNREMEVAKGTPFTILENNSFESLQALGPEKIGVMADLLVFDNIIGQGISNDIVELLAAYLDNQTIFKIRAEQAAAEQNDPTTDTTDTPADPDNAAAAGKDTATTTVTPPFDAATFKEQARLIYGNSAFLNPLPVRVVFSDLFMIEGLITATNVGFQKFSETMIPTVCQINIQMEALYFGFAKKKAYLTQQLSTWADQTAQDRKDQTAELTKYDKINTTAPKTLVWAISNELFYNRTTPNTSFNALCNSVLNLPTKSTTSMLSFKLYFTLAGNAGVLNQSDLSLARPNVYLYYNNNLIETHYGDFKTEKIKTKDNTFYLNGSIDVNFFAGAISTGLNPLSGSFDIKLNVDTQTYLKYTDTVTGQSQLTSKSELFRASFTFKSDDTTIFVNATQESVPIKDMTKAVGANRALVVNNKNAVLNGLFYQPQ